MNPCLHYQSALPVIEGDAIRLQTALLDERTAIRPTFFGSIFQFIWRIL